MRGAHSTDDLALLALVKQGNDLAYREIYNRYWERLYMYVFHSLRDHESSEEVVQDIFLELWEKREFISVNSSLSSYLFTAAKHDILNAMRFNKVRSAYAADFSAYAQRYDNSNEELQILHDLEATIERSLWELPEKCRTVYRMSRQQHIPNPTIAEQLNITTKTVENHLTYALKHLRTALGSLLTFLILIKVF